MKILLDECVTKKLKQHLGDYQVFTVTEMGWSGLKNGKLMTACIENGFDMLLTIDKNLAFQQNLDKYNITIVVLNTLSSKIEDILPLVPAFKQKAPAFNKARAYLIDP